MPRTPRPTDGTNPLHTLREKVRPGALAANGLPDPAAYPERGDYPERADHITAQRIQLIVPIFLAIWKEIQLWRTQKPAFMGLRTMTKGEHRRTRYPTASDLRPLASFREDPRTRRSLATLTYGTFYAALSKLYRSSAVRSKLIAPFNEAVSSNRDVYIADYFREDVLFGFVLMADIIGVGFDLLGDEAPAAAVAAAVRNSGPLFVELASLSRQAEPHLFAQTGTRSWGTGGGDSLVGYLSSGSAPMGYGNSAAFELCERSSKPAMRMKTAVGAKACKQMKQNDSGERRFGCPMLFAIDPDRNAPLLLSVLDWMLEIVERSEKS